MIGEQDFSKSFPSEALTRLDTLTRKGVLSDSVLQTIFRNSQIFGTESDLKMGRNIMTSQTAVSRYTRTRIRTPRYTAEEILLELPVFNTTGSLKSFDQGAFWSQHNIDAS